jgi:hypothetical protein
MPPKPLEAIVEKMQERIQKEMYDKYYSLYAIAIKFLQKEDVLMYGGTAINTIFPKKDKFYGDFELPDLDCFSTQAKSVADRLVAEYKKHDKSHVSTVRGALHDGTWKVMVNGAPIADISQISKASFKKLSNGAMEGDLGIKVPNLEFLRMTLYILMSQPIDSHRWTKVYERLVLFNKLYPVKAPECEAPKAGKAAPEDKTPKKSIKTIFEYLKSTPYIVFGANNLFINIASLAKTKVNSVSDVVEAGEDCVYILVDSKKELKETVEDIAKDLNKLHDKSREPNDPKFTASDKVFPSDDFISEHAFINCGDRKVMGVFSTGDVCLNYVPHNGVRVGTLHTIIRMLYSMYFSSYATLPLSTIKCLMSVMVTIQAKSLRKGSQQHGVLNQFVTDCYGDQPRIFTLRRDQFMRLKKANDEKAKK